MSAMDASDLAMQPTDTFASGRYSKRKRTPISYVMEELEVSDDESEFERPLVKVRKRVTINASVFSIEHHDRNATCSHPRLDPVRNARSFPFCSCQLKSVT